MVVWWFPAIRAAVPVARSAIVEFAAAQGASEERLVDIKLAVSEALTNVVVHAYDGAPGSIQVTAGVASGELSVLIADDGRGMGASGQGDGLGLGLTLISKVSDQFELAARSGGGTELRIRFDLARDRAAAPQSRGSIASAMAAAASRFSTIS
jgi:anti-sigma regulatory factor (Ser/Thr protein kinase)